MSGGYSARAQQKAASLSGYSGNSSGNRRSVRDQTPRDQTPRELTPRELTPRAQTPREPPNSGRRKGYAEIHKSGSSIRTSATASSLLSLGSSVPPAKEAFEEKVRTPRSTRYHPGKNPPADGYAGTSSHRLDQRDRGIRTNNIAESEASAAKLPTREHTNLSLQWVPECMNPEGGHPLLDHILEDPAKGPIYRGITSDSRSPRSPQTPEKTSTRDKRSMSEDSFDSLLFESKARRKGKLKPLFMENFESYNLLKNKKKGLTEEDRDRLYQYRTLAVDNHKQTYRIAGDQDLIPGGRKEFSKADRPASTALHQYNDKRLLAGFELERISKRRHADVRTNMESPELRHSMYWVGRELERHAMTMSGVMPRRSEEERRRPQSARDFLAHDEGDCQDVFKSVKQTKRSKETPALHGGTNKDNRVQRLYYELLRSTRPHMHHDLGTGMLVGGGPMKLTEGRNMKGFAEYQVARKL